MYGRYIDRPDATFLKGLFAICENICFASFCANVVLEINKNDDENNDWQPLVLGESVNETNHNKRLLSKAIPLITSRRLKCWKIPKVSRY